MALPQLGVRRGATLARTATVHPIAPRVVIPLPRSSVHPLAPRAAIPLLVDARRERIELHETLSFIAVVVSVSHALPRQRVIASRHRLQGFLRGNTPPTTIHCQAWNHPVLSVSVKLRHRDGLRAVKVLTNSVDPRRIGNLRHHEDRFLDREFLIEFTNPVRECHHHRQGDDRVRINSVVRTDCLLLPMLDLHPVRPHKVLHDVTALLFRPGHRNVNLSVDLLVPDDLPAVNPCDLTRATPPSLP